MQKLKCSQLYLNELVLQNGHHPGVKVNSKQIHNLLSYLPFLIIFIAGEIVDIGSNEIVFRAWIRRIFSAW